MANPALIAKEMIDRSGGNATLARQRLREIAPMRRWTTGDIGSADELLVQAEFGTLQPYHLEKMATSMHVWDDNGQPVPFGAQVLHRDYDNRFADPEKGYLATRSPNSTNVQPLSAANKSKGVISVGEGLNERFGAASISGPKAPGDPGLLGAWDKRLNLGGGQSAYVNLEKASGQEYPRRENVFDQGGLRSSGNVLNTMFVITPQIVRYPTGHPKAGEIDYDRTDPDAFVPGGLGIIQAGAQQSGYVPRFLEGITPDQVKTGIFNSAHTQLVSGSNKADHWVHLHDYDSVEVSLYNSKPVRGGTMVLMRFRQGAAGHNRSQTDIKTFTGAEADLANAERSILGVSPETLRQYQVEYLTSVDNLKTVGALQELVNEQVYRYGGPERYLTMMLGPDNSRKFLNERGGINWRAISTTSATNMGLPVDSRLDSATGGKASVFQHIAFQAALSPNGSGFKYTDDKRGLFTQFAHGAAREGAYEGAGKPRISGENFARLAAFDKNLADQVYEASQSRVQHYGELYRSLMSNVPATAESDRGSAPSMSFGVNQTVGGSNVINLDLHPEFSVEIRRLAAEIAKADGNRSEITAVDMFDAMKAAAKTGKVGALDFNSHTILKVGVDIAPGTSFGVSLPSLRNLEYFAGPQWKEDRPDENMPQNEGANTFTNEAYGQMVSSYSLNGLRMMSAAILGWQMQSKWFHNYVGAAAGMASGRETLTNALSFTAPHAYEGNYTVSTDIEPGVIVFSPEAIKKAFPEVTDPEKLKGLYRAITGLQVTGWRSPTGDITGRAILGGLRAMAYTPDMRWTSPHGVMVHPSTVSAMVGDVDGDRLLTMIKAKISGWGGPDGNMPIFNANEYHPSAAEMRAQYDYLVGKNQLAMEERKKVITDSEKLWKEDPKAAFRQHGGDIQEILLDYITRIPNGETGMFSGAEIQHAMGFLHESKTRIMTAPFNIAREGRAMDGDDDYGMLLFPAYQTGIDKQRLDPGMHTFVRYMSGYNAVTMGVSAFTSDDEYERLNTGHETAMKRALGGLVWSYAKADDVSPDGDPNGGGMRLNRMALLMEKLFGKKIGTTELAQRMITGVRENNWSIDVTGTAVAEMLGKTLEEKGVQGGTIWTNAHELGGLPKLFRLMAVGRGYAKGGDKPSSPGEIAEYEAAEAINASVALSSRRLGVHYDDDVASIENARRVSQAVYSNLTKANIAGDYGRVVARQRREVFGLNTFDPGVPSMATSKRRKMPAPGEQIGRASHRGMRLMEAAKGMDADRLADWVDTNWDSLTSIFQRAEVRLGEKPYRDEATYAPGEGGQGIARQLSATHSELFLSGIMDDPLVPETIKRGLESMLQAEGRNPRPMMTNGSPAPDFDPSLPSMAPRVTGSMPGKSEYDMASNLILNDSSFNARLAGRGSAAGFPGDVFGTAMHQLLGMVVQENNQLTGVAGVDYGWLSKYSRTIEKNLDGGLVDGIETGGRLDFLFKDLASQQQHLRDTKFYLQNHTLAGQPIELDQLYKLFGDTEAVKRLPEGYIKSLRQAVLQLEKAHEQQIQMYSHMAGLKPSDTAAFVFMPDGGDTEKLHATFAASGAGVASGGRPVDPIVKAILQAANNYSRDTNPRDASGAQVDSARSAAAQVQAQHSHAEFDPSKFIGEYLNPLLGAAGYQGEAISDMAGVAKLVGSVDGGILGRSLGEMMRNLNPEANDPKNIRQIKDHAIGKDRFEGIVKETWKDQKYAEGVLNEIKRLRGQDGRLNLPDTIDPKVADVLQNAIGNGQGEAPSWPEFMSAVQAFDQGRTHASVKFENNDRYRTAAATVNGAASGGTRFKTVDSYVNFMKQLLSGKRIDAASIFGTGTSVQWRNDKISHFISQHNALLSGDLDRRSVQTYNQNLTDIFGGALSREEQVALRESNNPEYKAVQAALYPGGREGGLGEIENSFQIAATRWAGERQPLMMVDGKLVADPNAPPHGEAGSRPKNFEQMSVHALPVHAQLTGLYGQISSMKAAIASDPNFSTSFELQKRYGVLQTQENYVNSALGSVETRDAAQGDIIGQQRVLRQIERGREVATIVGARVEQFASGNWEQDKAAEARESVARKIMDTDEYKAKREAHVESEYAASKAGIDKSYDLRVQRANQTASGLSAGARRLTARRLQAVDEKLEAALGAAPTEYDRDIAELNASEFQAGEGIRSKYDLETNAKAARAEAEKAEAAKYKKRLNRNNNWTGAWVNVSTGEIIKKQEYSRRIQEAGDTASHNSMLETNAQRQAAYQASSDAYTQARANVPSVDARRQAALAQHEEDVNAVSGMQSDAMASIETRRASRVDAAKAAREEAYQATRAAAGEQLDAKTLADARSGNPADIRRATEAFGDLEKVVRQNTAAMKLTSDETIKVSKSMNSMAAALDKAEKIDRARSELTEKMKSLPEGSAEKERLQWQEGELKGREDKYLKQAAWHKTQGEKTGLAGIMARLRGDSAMPDDIRTPEDENERKASRRAGIGSLFSGFTMFYMNRAWEHFVNPAVQGAVAGAKEDTQFRSTAAQAGLGLGAPSVSANALSGMRQFEAARDRQNATTWSGLIGDNVNGGLGSSFGAAQSVWGPALGAAFAGGFLGNSFGGPVGATIGAVGGFATTAAIGLSSRGGGIKKDPVGYGIEAARGRSRSGNGFVDSAANLAADITDVLSGANPYLARQYGAVHERSFERLGYSMDAFDYARSSGLTPSDVLREWVYGHGKANIEGVSLDGFNGVMNDNGFDDQTSLRVLQDAIKWRPGKNLNVRDWAAATASGANVTGLGQMYSSLLGGGSSLTQGINLALRYASDPAKVDEITASAERNPAVAMMYSGFSGPANITKNYVRDTTDNEIAALKMAEMTGSSLTPSQKSVLATGKYTESIATPNPALTSMDNAATAFANLPLAQKLAYNSQASRVSSLRDFFANRGMDVPGSLLYSHDTSDYGYDFQSAYNQQLAAANQQMGVASRIQQVQNVFEGSFGFEAAQVISNGVAGLSQADTFALTQRGSSIENQKAWFVSQGLSIPKEITDLDKLLEAKQYGEYAKNAPSKSRIVGDYQSRFSSIQNAFAGRIGSEGAFQMASNLSGNVSNFEAGFIASAAQGDPIALSAIGMASPNASFGGLSGSDLVTMQSNGLPMFTTSMGLGGESTAGKMFNFANWDPRTKGIMASISNPTTGNRGLYEALAGNYKPMNADRLGLNTYGGLWGLQQYASDQNYRYQMAGLGIQAASANMNWAFTSGQGLAPYQAKYADQFNQFVPAGTPILSQWELTKQNRDLDRSQTMWQWGFQDKNRDLQIRQFNETWDFNRSWSAKQYGWQQQDFGFTQRQRTMQRGWQEYDWSFDRNVRNMEFGWQLQDVDENIRFATGRDRRLMERQRGRMVTEHSITEQRASTEEKRVKETWKLEDERFEIEKKRAAETHKTNMERMDMEKRQFLERMALDKEGIERQKEYTREKWKLEDAAFAAQIAQQTEAHNLQLASIGNSIAQLKFNKDLEDVQRAITQEAEKANGKLRWAMTTQEKFWTSLGNWFNDAAAHGGKFRAFTLGSWGDSDKTKGSDLEGGSDKSGHGGASGFHGLLTKAQQRSFTVNEQGPEWVDVYPFGAKPPTLEEVARRSGGSSGGSGDTYVTVLLDGKEISSQVIKGTTRQIYQGRKRL